MRALVLVLLALTACGGTEPNSNVCSNALRFPDGGLMFPGSIKPEPWNQHAPCEAP